MTWIKKSNYHENFYKKVKLIHAKSLHYDSVNQSKIMLTSVKENFTKYWISENDNAFNMY